MPSSHVTRMFLQTKCVIWVKPKRSFSRGGRGRGSLKMDSKTATASLKGCAHIRRITDQTQRASDLGKRSMRTLNYLNAPRVMAKSRFSALYHTKITRSDELRIKMNVPFCYIKHTTGLVSVGICTTIRAI